MSEMSEPCRPSNGEEGEAFKERFCYRCTWWSDDCGCPIELQSAWSNVGDGEYPSQWIYQDGEPTCTAFEEAS